MELSVLVGMAMNIYLVYINEPKDYNNNIMICENKGEIFNLRGWKPWKGKFLYNTSFYDGNICIIPSDGNYFNYTINLNYIEGELYKYYNKSVCTGISFNSDCNHIFIKNIKIKYEKK